MPMRRKLTDVEPLRAYQEEQVKRVLKQLKTGKNVILQSPVGTGKTRMGIEIAKTFAGKVLWLAHSRELRDQANAYGNPSQLMTIQAAYRWKHGELALIVIDECHRTVGQTEMGMYLQLITQHPQTPILGLTATPLRADGISQMREKGGIYEILDLGYSIAWHVAQKNILAPKHYTSPEPIDLKGLKVKGGDYDMVAAGERLKTKRLCGNVLEHYIKHALGRQALVFACSVEHAEALTAVFNDASILARCVYGAQPTQIRNANLEAFKKGDYQVLVNVQLCTEGWDYPPLAIAIIARPTKSRTLYLQMVGRIMRVATGKKVPILLDHGGVFHTHGLVTDEFDWTTGRANSPRYVECPSCGLVHGDPIPDVCECGAALKLEDLQAQKRVRKSTMEESAEQLILTQEAAKRAAEAKAKSRRTMEPDWVPFEGYGVPSPEIQLEMKQKWLNSPPSGFYAYGSERAAKEYNISLIMARCILSMRRRQIYCPKNRWEGRGKKAIKDMTDAALWQLWCRHPERRHEFSNEDIKRMRKYMYLIQKKHRQKNKQLKGNNT